MYFDAEGTARQGHSEACRKRIEKELEGTDKAKRAKKRADEYMDKKAKEEKEKRRRRNGGSEASGSAEGGPERKDEEEDMGKRRRDSGE